MRASDELAEVRVLIKPRLSQCITVLTSTAHEREGWTCLHKCDSGSEGNFAKQLGTTVDAMLTRMANTTLLKRLPTLESAANLTSFVASE